MSKCVFLLVTAILSFIVYLGIMVHLKALNSEDWQWRINSVEGDLKLLMQNLNSCGNKNKMDTTKCRHSHNSDLSAIGTDETVIEDVIKKYTGNIKSDVQEMRKLVDQLLCKNRNSLTSSCKVQPINLATDSLGTKIVYIDDKPTCSIYNIVSWFGLQTLMNAPRELLNNHIEPGRCYAFKGSKSTIVIKLQKPVVINSVSIEHILQNMMPYGNNTNAPKKFAVHGLSDLTDRTCVESCEYCFGEFEYKIELNQALQIFHVLNRDPPCPFQFIKFSFLSNHGHPHNTCVYRIGVYGKVLQ